ncbi:MAG: tetratricopeptide repeat protein, partial [Bdellovibrionales bacterium]|nr:tetratricopeptide repeat protein [Bdellovibrionales bacterium]
LERLSAEMLASAYAAARVHVLPSWYELPGLVTLEAAFHGCNVVVTDCGTTRDYLGHKAFYCNPWDEKSIKIAVQEAMESPLVPGLKETVMKNSWDNAGQDTLDAYKAAISSAASGALSNSESKPVTAVYDLEGGATQFQDLLERGEIEARNRNYKKAHELLTRAELLNPNSARLMRAKAATFLAEEDVLSAEYYFERALRNSSDDAKAMIGKGMCAMMKEDRQSAYSLFVQALRIAPVELVAIHQLVECAFALNQFDDLKKVLECYLAQVPSDNEMRYCYAGCIYKLGDFEAAISLAKDILSAEPNHLGAQQLIELIEKERDSQEKNARVENEGGTSEQPATSGHIAGSTSTDTNFDVSEYGDFDRELDELDLEKRRMNLDSLREGCKKILENPKLNPNQRERAEVLLAEACVIDGQLAEAATRYERLLHTNPKCARALCGKGALAAHSGDWAGAESLFAEAFQADDRCDVALAGLGMCSTFKKDSNQAWSFYERALQINQENSRALLGFIELGYELKRLPEVERALQQYLDCNPVDFNFIYSLAGCFYAQGKIDEARQEVEKILLFEPEHANALELRDMIVGGGDAVASAGLRFNTVSS